MKAAILLVPLFGFAVDQIGELVHKMKEVLNENRFIGVNYFSVNVFLGIETANATGGDCYAVTRMQDFVHLFVDRIERV